MDSGISAKKGNLLDEMAISYVYCASVKNAKKGSQRVEHYIWDRLLHSDTRYSIMNPAYVSMDCDLPEGGPGYEDY